MKNNGVFFWRVSLSLGAFGVHGHVQRACPNHGFSCNFARFGFRNDHMILHVFSSRKEKKTVLLAKIFIFIQKLDREPNNTKTYVKLFFYWGTLKGFYKGAMWSPSLTSRCWNPLVAGIYLTVRGAIWPLEDVSVLPAALGKKIDRRLHFTLVPSRVLENCMFFDIGLFP